MPNKQFLVRHHRGSEMAYISIVFRPVNHKAEVQPRLGFVASVFSIYIEYLPEHVAHQVMKIDCLQRGSEVYEQAY